jgi:hypothetical protein
MKTSSEFKGMVSDDMKAAVSNAPDDSSQKKLDKLRDAERLGWARLYPRCSITSRWRRI